jgi:glutamate dehydrogenase/leucine dehydrogenase
MHLTFGAIVILIGLAINFGGLVLGYLELRRNQKDITDKQDNISISIDGRFTAAIDRIDQLSNKLTGEGIEVPPKPEEKTA